MGKLVYHDSAAVGNIYQELLLLSCARSRQTINKPPAAISIPPGNKVDHGASLKKSQPKINERGIPK